MTLRLNWQLNNGGPGESPALHMASYQFSKDGEVITLDEADKIIADAFEQLYRKDAFCLAYQYVVELGMAVYMRASATDITPEVVDKYISIKQERGETNAEFIEFIRRYQPFIDGSVLKFYAWR